jgi:hypothetical protein
MWNQQHGMTRAGIGRTRRPDSVMPAMTMLFAFVVLLLLTGKLFKKPTASAYVSNQVAGVQPPSGGPGGAAGSGSIGSAGGGGRGGGGAGDRGSSHSGSTSLLAEFQIKQRPCKVRQIASVRPPRKGAANAPTRRVSAMASKASNSSNTSKTSKRRSAEPTCADQ